MSQDFSQILSDFNPIFKNCEEGSFSPDAENFQSITTAINSVLSSWIFYLQHSAGLKNTLKVDFKKANCKNKQAFNLISPTSFEAIDQLKNASVSYLLTSLILTKLTSEKSEDKLYDALKQVVNKELSSGVDNNGMMVLNNPKMSGIVLLSLNALASAHYHNLLKKFYKRAIEISETMSQTDKDLAEMVIKQFPNVKNGVVPNSQTGGKRHRSHIIPASFHKRKY